MFKFKNRKTTLSDLDREIEDKKAEIDRLQKFRELELREIALDKREALLAIKEGNINYIVKLQNKVVMLERELKVKEPLILSPVNVEKLCNVIAKIGDTILFPSDGDPKGVTVLHKPTK